MWIWKHTLLQVGETDICHFVTLLNCFQPYLLTFTLRMYRQIDRNKYLSLFPQYSLPGSYTGIYSTYIFPFASFIEVSTTCLHSAAWKLEDEGYRVPTYSEVGLTLVVKPSPCNDKFYGVTYLACSGSAHLTASNPTYFPIRERD